MHTIAFSSISTSLIAAFDRSGCRLRLGYCKVSFHARASERVRLRTCTEVPTEGHNKLPLSLLRKAVCGTLHLFDLTLLLHYFLHSRFPWAKCDSNNTGNPLRLKYEGTTGQLASFTLWLKDVPRQGKCADEGVNKIVFLVGE